MELKVFFDELDGNWIVVAPKKKVGNEITGYYIPGVRFRTEHNKIDKSEADWSWCLFKKVPDGSGKNVGYQISRLPFSRTASTFVQRNFFDLYFETEQSKQHVYDAFVEFHNAVFPELLKGCESTPEKS